MAGDLADYFEIEPGELLEHAPLNDDRPDLWRPGTQAGASVPSTFKSGVPVEACGDLVETNFRYWEGLVETMEAYVINSSIEIYISPHFSTCTKKCCKGIHSLH